jgi:carbon monoxide dehydrogenase subunit G
MEMTGEYRIAAPRETVWEALNDTEILARAVPGCEEIEKLSDTEMTATVSAKVGPVKARFKGAVTLSDIDAPNGYTLNGEGKGGVAGFAKGTARVNLAEDGDGTLLSYEVDAQVGGKLAQVGSRLIDSTAKKLAGEFFGTFSEIVGAGEGTGGGADADPEATETPSETSLMQKPVTWIVIGVVIAAIAYSLLA